MPGYPLFATVLAAPKATPGPLWVGILFSVVASVALIVILYALKRRGH